jgi:hypothetical protein
LPSAEGDKPDESREADKRRLGHLDPTLPECGERQTAMTTDASRVMTSSPITMAAPAMAPAAAAVAPLMKPWSR